MEDQLMVRDELMTMANVERRLGMIAQFYEKAMMEGVDYMTIPGTSGKPSLLQSGAQKLAMLFRLGVEIEIEEKVEDWTGKDHDGESFFYYRVRCKASRNGQHLGEGLGSANSWEGNYRYRWVSEGDIPPGQRAEDLPYREVEYRCLAWQLQKAETTGKYAKPVEYWRMFHEALAAGKAKQYTAPNRFNPNEQDVGYIVTDRAYRISNPDLASQVNTILKMAVKRAYVSCILSATAVGAFFTVDFEDLPGFGWSESEVIDHVVMSQHEDKPEETKAESKAEPKQAEPKQDKDKPWHRDAAQWADYLKQGSIAYKITTQQVASAIDATQFATMAEAQAALEEALIPSHWSQDQDQLDVLIANLGMTYDEAPEELIKLVDLTKYEDSDAAFDAIGEKLDEAR